MSAVQSASRCVAAEQLDVCAVDLEVQREFLRAGFVRLERLWTDTFAAALSAEATAAWPDAKQPTAGPRTPITGDRARLRQTPVATGALLDALHAALTRLVRTLAGRLLVPSFAAYGYYEHDEECILHYDTDASEVTLLVMALGQVGPLRVHPELRGLDVEGLGGLEDDPTWDRTSGLPVAYTRTGLTAIRGQVLPHHRPAGAVTELSAVAALHYRSAFSSSSPTS